MTVQLPVELTLDILHDLAAAHPAVIPTIIRLSRLHYRLFTPVLYRNIAVRDRTTLEQLARSLHNRPSLAEHVSSFFFQGPQGRSISGKDVLALLDNEEIDGAEHDESVRSEHESVAQQASTKTNLRTLHGDEEQDATWDEHEALMHLCASILRRFSSRVRSIGFVDCTPWFLALSEEVKQQFPIVSCREFTGVATGLFGMLPHLKASPSLLERIHLIGGDFGSFALQRVLLESPTVQRLTHLHISAPSLYRAEHHSHLAAHITNLLANTPSLRRISVGILQWQTPPAPTTHTHFSQSLSSRKEDDDDDERLVRCRKAYEFALPQALQQSGRTDVRVTLLKIPFAQGSPVGFAGWIMKHHRPAASTASFAAADWSCQKNNTHRAAWVRRWRQRDLTSLPSHLSPDGTPAASVWDLPPTVEWMYEVEHGVRIVKGSLESW